MVGDRLDTDIEGAHNAGVDSLLVLTGVTGLAELVAAAPRRSDRRTSLPTSRACSSRRRRPRSPTGAARSGGWTAGWTPAALARRGRRSADDWWRVVAAAAWQHLDDDRRAPVDGRAPDRSAGGSRAGHDGRTPRPTCHGPRRAVGRRRADRRRPSGSRTGVARVDDVIAAVEELEERPIEEHVGVFESAHEQLRARARTRPSRPTRDRPGLTGAATSPPAGRRAGPPRTGPLARARRELIADGRVKVSGATRDQAGHRRHHRRRRSWWPTDPDRPDYVSRGGHKLAGALAAFEPAGWSSPGAAASTRARRRAASPTCCCAHGAAQVVAVDVGLRPAGLAAPAGRPGRGARPDERPRARRPSRSAARSTWSWATCPSSRWSWCWTPLIGGHRRGRRPGADGQAAVRGGQGPRGQGRRGPRPGAARRGGRGGGRGGGRPGAGAPRAVTAQSAAGAVGQRRVLPVAAARRRPPSDRPRSTRWCRPVPRGGAG